MARRRVAQEKKTLSAVYTYSRTYLYIPGAHVPGKVLCGTRCQVRTFELTAVVTRDWHVPVSKYRVPVIERGKKYRLLVRVNRLSVSSYRPSVQQHSRARARDKRCHVGRGAERVDSEDAAPGGSLLYHSRNDECMNEHHRADHQRRTFVGNLQSSEQ